MEMTATTGTALALPEPTTLATLFRAENGLDPIIAQIEAEVRAHVPDLTTKKGRDAIASLAFKVSRSKTALDEAGKTLNEDARKQIGIVDAARRQVRDRLDALRDEARKPLDQWEAAEAARVSRCKAVIASITGHGITGHEESSEILAKAQEIKAVEIGEDFGEFFEIATNARLAALDTLRGFYAGAKAREDQAEELARLRLENERLEKERADREAAELAEREAREAAAKAEADRIAEEERAAREAEEATAREKARAEQVEREKAEAAERAAKEAEARAKAEAEAVARASAEREAELQRQIEEANAREERAAQAERDRIADEQRAADEARAKREADAAHRAKIAADIAGALRTMAGRATPEAIADALIAGQIPHCTVRM